MSSSSRSISATILTLLCTFATVAPACGDSYPQVFFGNLPSFIIAEKGVRSALSPFYVAGPFQFPGAPERTCHCTLKNGPAGVSVSDDGVVQWVPHTADVGTEATLQIGVSVTENGQEIFATTRSFTTTVLEQIPQLAEPAPISTYEHNPLGWNNITFSGFQPSDTDLALFKWSLIDPPPGVYIDAAGGLHWPDDSGYARPEPYVFQVRIDYQTLSGPVSDQVTYTHYVLPRQATHNYADFQYDLQPQSKAMLGYSLAAADGWIVAGEPFPGAAWNAGGNPNTGRVRLWQANTQGGSGLFIETGLLQPGSGPGGQAFGSSVAMSPANGATPTRLAVGAPEASRTKAGFGVMVEVGSVYVYACDTDGNWSSEAKLEPPVIQQSLRFGDWVSIEGDVLVASMSGYNPPASGYNSGALAVYRRGATGWKYAETLQTPDPKFGDLLGTAVQLSGDWIAAAAPGDDDSGDSAGSVHLYQFDGAHFVHRQEIHAPAASAGAGFGERILMKDSWLFVSSFRGNSCTGAVHVYRLSGGIWTYRQTLTSPYAVAGSAFGVGLSVSGDVLAVSAPAYLFNDLEVDGADYAWRGITLFHLSGDSWTWQRQITESPDGNPGQNTWGFALAQLSPEMTVASEPDFTGNTNGSDALPLAGRLFLHQWPDLLPDPLIAGLAALPMVDGQAAKAGGDNNHNGIPNIIDLMLGHDPAGPPDSWTSEVPESIRSFLRVDSTSGEVRLMIPQLLDGLNRPVVVESSANLVDWNPVSGARWEAQEEVYFPHNGSNYLTYFSPVLVRSAGTGNEPVRFYRWGVATE